MTVLLLVCSGVGNPGLYAPWLQLLGCVVVWLRLESRSSALALLVVVASTALDPRRASSPDDLVPLNG